MKNTTVYYDLTEWGPVDWVLPPTVQQHVAIYDLKLRPIGESYERQIWREFGSPGLEHISVEGVFLTGKVLYFPIHYRSLVT